MRPKTKRRERRAEKTDPVSVNRTVQAARNKQTLVARALLLTKQLSRLVRGGSANSPQCWPGATSPGPPSTDYTHTPNCANTPLCTPPQLP